MIEYIHLINFQNHSDKRIDFTGDVNYITGKNGEGKSATLRAIQWVAMNKGNSKQFRRTYATENGDIKTSSETSVEIGVDGHVVKRVVGNTKNEYWLDGIKLTGFGRNAPDAVLDLFKMSSINVSEQFSPLFLVGETAGGVVAEELSKIANLDSMEALTDSVNADIRKDNASIEALKEELDKVSQNAIYLRSYAPTIDKAYQEVKSIEEAYNSCYNCINDTEMIFNCLLSCKPTYDAKQVLKKVESISIPERENLSEIEEVVEYLNTHKESSVVIPTLDITFDRENLEDLEDTLKGLSSIEAIYNMKKADLKNVEDALATFKVCPLCGNELKDCKHV